LTDATLKTLNRQNRWPVLKTISKLAVESAKNPNKEDKIPKYQFEFAKTNYHQGDYAKSITLSDIALKSARKLDQNSLEAEILTHIGSMYRFEGKKEKAIQYANEAEAIARKLGDQITISKCYFSKGKIEHGSGNFSKALELYNKVLAMGNTKERRRAMGDRLLDLLRIRGGYGFDLEILRRGEENSIDPEILRTKGINGFDLAKESWELMLKYAKELASTYHIIAAKARLTLIEPDIDLFEMQQAWKDDLNETILAGKKVASITSYGELAEVLIRRKKFKESIELCKKGEEVGKKLNNLHARSGKAYTRGIRLIAEGKVDEAKKELDLSEKLFAKWTSPYRYWVAGTIDRLKKYINSENNS
ncbi:MAG: tetratricopeptide repeat protein, partial [Promethearchaeota archaeon]